MLMRLGDKLANRAVELQDLEREGFEADVDAAS